MLTSTRRLTDHPRLPTNPPPTLQHQPGPPAEPPRRPLRPYFRNKVPGFISLQPDSGFGEAPDEA